jgi:aldehyde:ferredoxin oxidoreductase
MYGWTGSVLEVDMTARGADRVPLDAEVARSFIGGRGLNSKTLFDRIRPGIDPLGPENILCLAVSPLTATPLPLTGRLEVSTLSPYSGILGDGNVGGFLASHIKRAGYDQIVLCGAADRPTYLWIEDDRVEFREASDLWGKSTWETTDILRDRHGNDLSVACIGPAGENLVRFASTIVDKHSSAARGSGAVWGSKQLKAIAVRGTGHVKLAEPEVFKQLAGEDREFFLNDPFQRNVVAVYGTHIGMMCWGPSRNNFARRLTPDEIPEALTPQGWKKYEVGRTGCSSCPVRCKNVYRIPHGPRAGELGAGLEYECIDCLGTNCGIEDPIAIMEMGNLADAYGMDVIALGNTLAFVKELYHRGIIDQRDTGGLSLEWQDTASQIELIHQTALREGFGNLVAEGLYNVAKRIGPEAMAYCYHVKGLSRGPHSAGPFSLAHATSTRGADHLRGRSWMGGDNAPGDVFLLLIEAGVLPREITQDPVQALIISERATTLADALGRCKGGVNSWVCAVPLVWKYPLWEGLAKLLTAATGWQFDPPALEQAADRIYTLERAFNVRQGTTRVDDRIPQQAEVAGTLEGLSDLARHEEMLSAYYRASGCQVETGVPTRERLEQLGLAKVADELETHQPRPAWDGPPLWSAEQYPHGGARA